MRRSAAAVVMVVVSVLLTAKMASGQSILRLGAAHVDRVCPIADGMTVLAPDRPWQPGDPPPSIEARAPLPDCRDPTFGPLVVNRARRLTISLPYPGALEMGAAWFSGDGRRTLLVEPISGPPAQTWFIRVPMQTGRLLVHQWGLPRPSSTNRGGVVQHRTDWKVTIRRRS